MITKETIEEHLKELHLTNSKKPNILQYFIDYWEDKLIEVNTNKH